MNIAHFKALDITAFIGNNRFQDLGYVGSIPKKLKEIDKIHGISKDIEEYHEKYKFHSGLFVQINLDYYIFYLNQQNKYDNLVTIAHEETHALDNLNLLCILEEKLFENQQVKINLREIGEREMIADIGGIYVANMKDFNFFTRFFSLHEEDKNFKKAKKIYNQSKLPKKKFFIF